MPSYTSVIALLICVAAVSALRADKLSPAIDSEYESDFAETAENLFPTPDFQDESDFADTVENVQSEFEESQQLDIESSNATSRNATTPVDPETFKQQQTAAALAAHGGDHRALFATLMQHIRTNLDSMKSNTDSQLAAVTARRDSSRVVLDLATQRAAEVETAFSNAAAAKRAVDLSCKNAQDASLMSQAVLTAASASFNERNPVVEKELAVISMIILKVADLKAINLQETRDMVSNLQTFEEEAKPLMEMIDIAREHAEFTKPILDLLRQLQAKLLAERDSLSSAVASATSAHVNRKSIVDDACSKVDARRIELADAETRLNSAKSALSAAQREFDDLQQVWTKTHTSAQAFRLAWLSETRSLDRLRTCALAPADTNGDIESFSIDRSTNMVPAWGYGGSTDAVTFQVSKAIGLSGISFCKWISGTTHSDVTITLIEGSSTNGRVLASRVLSQVKLDTGNIIPLMFERPVRLSPFTAYTVTAMMKGSMLTQHMPSATITVSGAGLTLTTQSTNWNGPFNSNGSDQNRGQMPRFFFASETV